MTFAISFFFSFQARTIYLFIYSFLKLQIKIVAPPPPQTPPTSQKSRQQFRQRQVKPDVHLRLCRGRPRVQTPTKGRALQAGADWLADATGAATARRLLPFPGGRRRAQAKIHGPAENRAVHPREPARYEDQGCPTSPDRASTHQRNRK